MRARTTQATWPRAARELFWLLALPLAALILGAAATAQVLPGTQPIATSTSR